MSILLLVLIAAQSTGAIPQLTQANIAWTAEGGFCEPETVLPLPDNTLLVSNVCDFRTADDGYLTLLAATGDVINWRIVEGLDSPLGMTMLADLIYVVDSNQVIVIHWPSFEQRSTVSLDTRVANDIAVASDGTIYVTDTAQGEVVIVSPALEQSKLIGEAQFKGANGIHLDGDVLYVGGERLWHIELRDGNVSTIGPAWLTDIDGIEMESNGTLQVTPVGGPLVRLAAEVEVIGGGGVSSANHGFAGDLGLALIPTGFDNTVIAITVSQDVNAPDDD